MSSIKQNTVLDLFCGAGGFSKGFQMAGYKILAGIDNDPSMRNTYVQNINADFIEHDISENVISKYSPDVLLASPPCQGFSDARGNRVPKDEKDKKRNNLYISIIEWLKEIKPKVLIFENVEGFKTHSNDYVEEFISRLNKINYTVETDILDSSEFSVPQKRKRFFALAYQKSLYKNISFFNKLRKEKNDKKYTVEDCFFGLPNETFEKEDIEFDLVEKKQNDYLRIINNGNIVNTTKNHFSRNISEKDVKIAKLIPQGKSFRSDRFGEKSYAIWELAKDYSSEYSELLLSDQELLLIKEIAKKRLDKQIKTRKGKYQEGYVPLEFLSNKRTILNLVKKEYLKFDENESSVDLTVKAGHRSRFRRLNLKDSSPTILVHSFNPRELMHPLETRSITLREGARIQSFPDSYIFYGNFREISKQIGNAVPPLLAKKIGVLINELFLSKS